MQLNHIPNPSLTNLPSTGQDNISVSHNPPKTPSTSVLGEKFSELSNLLKGYHTWLDDPISSRTSLSLQPTSWEEVSAYYYDTQIPPYTYTPSSLVPTSASTACSEYSSKTVVSSCPTLARLWALDQNPEHLHPSPTKIALSHILLGAILLWENGSTTIGHYVQRVLSPFSQLRLQPLSRSLGSTFTNDPFGSFVDLNTLITRYLKQYALSIVIPHRTNYSDLKKINSLTSSKIKNITPETLKLRTTFPLTPLDNLPGLVATLLDQKVSFLLDSDVVIILSTAPF